VTLANPEVLKALHEDFVVGWKNIEREPWRGESQGYSCTQTALGTTNGAGARNVQIFVLSADLRVLHALPGFWHPDDLRRELEFARLAHRLWADEGRTLAQKQSMLAVLRKDHVTRLPALTLARSDWQDFDRVAELSPGRPWRDTFRTGKDGEVDLKPTILVAHDRMARMAFAEFARFDVEAFTDYGLLHYDNNAGFDRQAAQFAPKPAPKPTRAQP
jgi:hypothetical protein